MSTTNVYLPDPMTAWVETEAKLAHFSHAGDYFRSQIRHKQERALKPAELQRLVTEGLKDLVSEMSTHEVIAAARTTTIFSYAL